MLIPELFPCRPEGIRSITQPHMEIRCSRNANTVTHVLAAALVLQFGIYCEIFMPARYYGVIHVLYCCKHAMQFTLGLMCRAKRRCVDDGHMHGDGEDTLLIQQSQEIQPFRTEQFKILVKTGCTDLLNIFTISVTSDAVGQV